MRLLLVEDDKAVGSFVRRGLVQEGFSVDHSPDGLDGFHHALHQPYDAIILDILLPFMSGLDIVSQIRGEGRQTPVLLLSAKDSVEDRVRGLNAGADDYLVKPFAFSELTARVQALLRRHSSLDKSVLRVGDLEIAVATRRVTRHGAQIRLTPKEYSLLEFMARNQGSVLTRTMIAEHVWDQHFDSFSNVIDVYIRYLRAKIDDAAKTKLIHTIRGVGYVLSEEAP